MRPVLALGSHYSAYGYVRKEIRADFERSFRTLRSLPVDIWVTAHAREFGRYRKFRERERVPDPVAPFIDRDGYLRSIDSGEMRFRKLLAEQQRRPLPCFSAATPPAAGAAT